MNTLGIKICFQTAKDLNNLLEKIIENNMFGFSPDIMNFNDEQKYDAELAKKEIEINKDLNGIIFRSNDEQIEFLISSPGIIEGPVTLLWKIKTSNFMPDFKAFFTEDGFLCCFVYDYEDVYWQSKENPSAFEIHGKEHKHLKRIKDKWGREIIDVSKNYGREILLKNTWLLAAPVMWFSELFFEITGINKSDILKLKEAELQENGIIKVKLIDDIFKSSFDESRKKQKQFMHYANFEKVIKKLWPY